jgi:hypothetical protein
MTFRIASGLLSEIKKDKQGALLKFRNGVDFFVLPLARLTVNFCDKLMDSAGIRDALQSAEFADFVRSNPSVEFVIEPRRGRRPVFRASYLNGTLLPDSQDRVERVVQLKNLDPKAIMCRLRELREDSGQPRRRFRPGVHSDTPAIRPIWSPFHDNVEANNPLHALKQLVAEKKALEQASIARSLSQLPVDPIQIGRKKITNYN